MGAGGRKAAWKRAGGGRTLRGKKSRSPGSGRSLQAVAGPVRGSAAAAQAKAPESSNGQSLLPPDGEAEAHL